MRPVDALLLCCALACFGCPGQAPSVGNATPVAQEEPVAPVLPPSELPEAIPADTSISYRVDVEAEHIDQLKLTPSMFELLSARGRRHLTVRYSTPKDVLGAVYGTLRAQACDQVRSRVERAPSRGGTILQLRAGGVRNVINDRDKFFPEPQWTDAYKACATALDEAFPSRGTRPAAQLRLEFAEKLSHAVNVSANVGPDLLGISWDDDERVATVDIATVRPVEVSIRSGAASERKLVDLKTHAGLKIGVGDGPRVLSVVALEEPAALVGGEVPAGVDKRAAEGAAGASPAVGAKSVASPAEGETAEPAKPEPTDGPGESKKAAAGPAVAPAGSDRPAKGRKPTAPPP